LGIGDWGLGIGDWAQSPIPNPQSPIQIELFYILKNYDLKRIKTKIYIFIYQNYIKTILIKYKS
jgi:hypothetical protein